MSTSKRRHAHSEHFLPPEGYKNLKRLGGGRAGNVYLADGPKGKRYALKHIVSEDVLTELRGNLARHQGLSHTNLVTVFDVLQSRPRSREAWIVMEYIPGKSLQDVIRERPFLSHQEIRDIVNQLARGLGYLHTQGVLHRDVHPGNVIIARDGTVRITDYGLAVPLGAKAPAGTLVGTRHSQHGAIWGHYAAPEVWDGKYSPRSDLYALGCILYQLCTGVVPFVAETTEKLRELHRSDDVALWRVPQAFRVAVGCALAKSPRHRPRDTNEFQELLTAHDVALRLPSRGPALCEAARVLPVESGPVQSLAAEDSGRVLVVSAKAVSLWSLPEGRLVKRVRHHSPVPLAAAWVREEGTDTSQAVFSRPEGLGALWPDLTHPEWVTEDSDPESVQRMSLCVSPCGSQFVRVCERVGKLTSIELVTWRSPFTWRPQDEPPRIVKLPDQDGAVRCCIDAFGWGVVTVDARGEACVWDLNGNVHGGPARGPFVPSEIASGLDPQDVLYIRSGELASVRIYVTEERAPDVIRYPLSPGPVRCSAWWGEASMGGLCGRGPQARRKLMRSEPDSTGSAIFIGMNEKVCGYFYDARQRRLTPCVELPAPGEEISTLALVPEREWLLGGTKSGKLYVWSLTGRPLG